MQARPVFVYEGVGYHTYAYITLPYASKGRVLDLLVTANKYRYKISQDLEKYIIRWLISGVTELKLLSGLSHLDIKLDNCCIDDSFIPKLIDFGTCEPCGESFDASVKATGTPQYQAPEVLTRN